MAEVAQPSLMFAADSTEISHAESDSLLPYRICLVGSLGEDQETMDAAKKFGLPIVISENGLNFTPDTEYATYFIVSDFESSQFDELQKLGARIFGKPALIEMSTEGVLSYKSRPVFCMVMRNCVVVFTGFRRKTEVSRLLKLVHYMGGSIKNEITERVTHLLAHSSTGEKYQYAVTFDIPVMGEDWVNAAWAHRDEVGVKAEGESLMRYKLKLFHNLKIALVGFSDEDKIQMEDLIQKNGGVVATVEDGSTSHVVLDDQNILEKPANCPEKALVVKGEWFWASIQMDACANEQMYLFEPNINNFFSPRQRMFSPGTPGSRSRRRKRLRETVQQLAENDSPSGIQTAPPASKRRSSVGDLAFLSADGSLLEDSFPVIGTPATDKTPLSPPSIDLRQLSPRQRVFHELVKTECNYVAILDTINNIIKEPLENPNQPGGPMLDSQELRYIFGNLPPIHEVHKKLRSQLLHLSYHWTDDASIGKIILGYTSDLEKAYPPFVNYFENVKEVLQKITLERPRFHAFLKIAQNKIECGRQSFQELLIRPVQRLPSMSLLIQDIKKHTDKASPDFAALEEALDKIKSIMTFINDDKRKTEAKLKLFEIHNDIENCPPNLVASHRTYVSKVDVIELSDTCSGRGDSLSLFLFNDIVEICKKKSKYNSIKSPSRVNLTTLKIKGYKHLEMMPLAHIKRVVDIRETEECRNVFAIIVRSNQELKERLYTFTLIPDETNKPLFLRALSYNTANVVCRSDVENFIVTMDPHHLDIETSDVSLTNALSKALRFATRTGRKVSRAFSFNKSPSKIKRAVSTVMSPFGNSSNYGMRGATSVNNLALTVSTESSKGRTCECPLPKSETSCETCETSKNGDLSLSATPPCGRAGTMPAPMSTPTPRRKLPIKRL